MSNYYNWKRELILFVGVAVVLIFMSISVIPRIRAIHKDRREEIKWDSEGYFVYGDKVSMALYIPVLYECSYYYDKGKIIRK